MCVKSKPKTDIPLPIIRTHAELSHLITTRSLYNAQPIVKYMSSRRWNDLLWKNVIVKLQVRFSITLENIWARNSRRYQADAYATNPPTCQYGTRPSLEVSWSSFPLTLIAVNKGKWLILVSIEYYASLGLSCHPWFINAFHDRMTGHRWSWCAS